MTKSIVFFADGTWNHPGETDNGITANTNVYKMFTAAKPNCATQIKHYDDGVGADGTPVDHLLGGVMGAGLLAKIKDGYAFIANTFRSGDQIYLFGFSRGAYTVRSLAGMIAVCGLPDYDRLSDKAVDDAFNVYRTRTNREPLLDALRNNYGNNTHNIEIAMVGVWDTVGAMGIPVDLFEGLDTQMYGFLDTTLHPDVQSAYQALSIDERRSEFAPTLWISNGTSALEQVWFAGVHADVGGGYAESGLSDITLSWMMKNASSRGVQFDPDVYAKRTAVQPKHALDAMHNSWSVLYGFPSARTISPDSALANSVKIRVTNSASYRPENISISNGVLAQSYTIEPVV